MLRHEFRVDTLSTRLICSTCRCQDVIAIDALVSDWCIRAPASVLRLWKSLTKTCFGQGRVLDIKGVSYILCPGCCSIHQYHPDAREPWPLTCCAPKKKERQDRLPPVKCSVCNE